MERYARYHKLEHYEIVDMDLRFCNSRIMTNTMHLSFRKAYSILLLSEMGHVMDNEYYHGKLKTHNEEDDAHVYLKGVSFL